MELRGFSRWRWALAVILVVLASSLTGKALASDHQVPLDDAVLSDEQPDAPDDGTLYVVEETTVRDRQARLLSDGTVEAETDTGWMRFENMEHLNEYLDAMSS